MTGHGTFRTRRLRKLVSCLALLVFTGMLAAPAQAQLAEPIDPSLYAGQCNFSNIPGVVWWGTERQMTVERLASYAAPIYWFSPDEPLLRGAEGRDMMMPSNLPFEDSASAPVVYYQLDEIVTVKDYPGQEFTLDPDDKGQSMLDLEGIGLFRLGFFAYYPSEAGLGAHQHDLEAAEFKIGIMRSDGEILPELTEARCDERNYVMVVTRVVG